MIKFQASFTRVVLVPSMFAVTAGTKHETFETNRFRKRAREDRHSDMLLMSVSYLHAGCEVNGDDADYW
jgi:hypothetical protein